jgi:hypothetical protein
MPLTDFGLGFDEEERRQAMRQALVEAGMAIMGRAPTEGFGAFGAGGTAFLGGYRSSLEDMDKRRRQQREDELEDQYRKERTESYKAATEDRLERGKERDEEKAARKADLDARKAAIAEIADDKVRGELELRIAQPNFWEVYDKRTEPAKDKKAPEVRNFEDGTTREWDPMTGDWKVLARKPPERNDAPSLSEAMASSRSKREASASADARKAALKRADAEIANLRKQNRKGTAPEVPIPARLELAKKYEIAELGASRYREALPPLSSAPQAAPARPAPMPMMAAPPAAPRALPTTATAAVPGAEPSPASPEQTRELAALVENRVGSLNLPPEVSRMRKAQILARVKQALAQGITPEQILEELR